MTSHINKDIYRNNIHLHPAVVAWIVRVLLLLSVEEYSLAIGRSNLAWGKNNYYYYYYSFKFK